MPKQSSILVNKKLTLFIYRIKGAPLGKMRLHRALHGRREIRVTKDKFGRVIHKTFEYPGIPHQDIIPGVIAVERAEVTRIEKKFRQLDVSYLLIHPKTATQFGNWSNQKPP